MSDLLGPQQVILVTSKADIETFGKEVTKEDIDSVYWHMPVSKDELLYAIAMHNSKLITSIINKSGVFVVNFLPFDMGKKASECGLLHGMHIDKFSKLGFLKEEASAIECPRIKEACGYLECHVVETHKYADYTLFIAKIINSSTQYNVKRLFHLRNDIYTTTKDI